LTKYYGKEERDFKETPIIDPMEEKLSTR
jgi:hypothetical protein